MDAGSNPPGAEASAREQALLGALARRFPTRDHVLAEIARLSAELTLPKGTVHVVSDIHGEDAKLRHIIKNASGTLRPQVERLFAGRPAAERQALLTLLFYPREMLDRLAPELADPARRRAFVRRAVEDLLALVRSMSGRYGFRQVRGLIPPEYSELLSEVLLDPSAQRGAAYLEALLDPLLVHGRERYLIRLLVRLVRNLAVSELVVAGDCYDRGPRGDRVVEYLSRQPNVAFTWGNHDAAWIGACLGQEALIAQVLRISIRYRRLSQLEEGYGITLQPLEHLVRTVYGDDPAECFRVQGGGLREPLMLARMQKAAAVLQFKLEGQAIGRNPEWQLEHRRLLRGLDPASGTIRIDGQRHALKDRHFPTLDPAQPEALSGEERRCLERLRCSFLASPSLWRHVRFLVARGAMWLRRDEHLIFHGCVPVDDQGSFLPLVVDGQPRAGRALFDALGRVVKRSLERPVQKDLDGFWYLWSGPRSPVFGKDRIATLERDLIEDPASHVETKNPYFRLLHEPAFCDRVLEEFGVDPERGLIVNGHVPVRIDEGESPMKRSGKAITIDGAFSEAYGDHGYTLVLDAERTFLARHHHFESVEAAVRDGVDIIPEISTVRDWEGERRVAETERGRVIRAEIELLERLLEAFQNSEIREEQRG